MHSLYLKKVEDITIESEQHTNANINYLKFKINYLDMISYNSN